MGGVLSISVILKNSGEGAAPTSLMAIPVFDPSDFEAVLLCLTGHILPELDFREGFLPAILRFYPETEQ